MEAQSIILCIAGPSGSGKTTFAKNLISKFPKEDTLLISQDSYYKDLSHLTTNERANQNFDHPNSLDFDLLHQHLLSLKKGQEIFQPLYDFKTHCRIKKTKPISPKKIIVVEGTLVLSEKSILPLYDLSLYIELDQETCLERRIKRDLTERGRTKESVIKQYNTTVKPMFDAFIAPSKSAAQYIIPGANNNKYLNQIVELLKKNKNILQ